ncbi:MAG: Hsp20/alpha crystallin family protein [Verrucomicrobiae bacterium]
MTELDALQNRMSSFFGSPLIRRPIGDGILPSDEWALPVDVSEGPTEFVITAELPEVKKEDVKITVEDGMLKIAGERKFEKEENGIKYHRIERSYGAFARSFVIPEGAKGDKVSAEFREGLLKVHLPKCEKARPKAIEIDVA